MAPSTTSCHRIIDSPTVQATNSLLWGENTAILVRGIDWYDDKVTQERKFQENPAYITQNTPLLPASLIHASMRAPNTMYPGSRRAAAGVLVGSQLVMNNHSTTTTTILFPSQSVILPMLGRTNAMLSIKMARVVIQIACREFVCESSV